ncbi:MAG: ThiF family adenylyltransferase [Fimbriimonadales bacterium]|nr:ThiF family adenylyltransferase [Fimbriimonadales bacterium]
MRLEKPTHVKIQYRVVREVYAAQQRGAQPFVAVRAATAAYGEDLDWLVVGIESPQPSEPTVLLTAQPLSVVELPESSKPFVVVSLTPDGAIEAVLVCPQSGVSRLAVSVIGPEMPVYDPYEPEQVSHYEAVRWSRQEGALGTYASRRLRRLHFGIVGAGRLGAKAAQELAHRGARRLLLVDYDRVERHNTEYPVEAIGSHKVKALASLLKAQYPEMHVVGVPRSVSDMEAVRCLKGCDVMIVCTDHDGARFMAHALGAAYLIPTLDIATGVLHDGTQGADIRWCVPGDGCLLCQGGIVRTEHLHEGTLRGLYAELRQQRARDWRTERRGTRATLNGIAVNLGIGLLEDYLRGELRTGRWLRLLYNGATPQITVVESGKPDNCFCRDFGSGDEGVVNNFSRTYR